MVRVFVQCVDNVNTMLSFPTQRDVDKFLNDVHNTPPGDTFWVRIYGTTYIFGKKNLVKITTPWPPPDR